MSDILNEQALAELVATLCREHLAKHAIDPDGFISVERAAQRLDVSVSMIRKAIREKRLPVFNVGACVRVRVGDVDALAKPAGGLNSAELLRDRVLARARGGRR